MFLFNVAILTPKGIIEAFIFLLIISILLQYT